MHILCDAAHRTPVHSDAPESIKPTCAGHGAVGWRSACDAAESARAGNTLEATPERVDPRGSRPSCASDPGRAGGRAGCAPATRGVLPVERARFKPATAASLGSITA